MADRTAENKNSATPSVVVFVVWGIVLLVAFFANRGADVGQIGNLIGRLGGGSIAGAGIVDSVIGVVAALLIVISWFGYGSFATSFITAEKSEEHSHILELAMKTAVGSAICSLIWFFLGVTTLYNPAAAVIVLIAGLALAGLSFSKVRESKQESRVPEKASAIDRVSLFLIAIPVVLSFVASIAPPTAKDTLLYHFALPKAFIAQGGNGFVDGNIASYLALGTEMHNVWAMLLGGIASTRGGEAAAGVINWVFFPLLLMVVFGWARELKIERGWALIAVLMVASVPSVYYVAANAYVDLALALFVTLAIFALSRWWKSLTIGWTIYVAIFLGAALSIKLTTVVVIAAFALVIVFRARQAKELDPDNIRRIFVGGFAALLLAGVIASPWYLRTWKETGSPVFPFYTNIWKGEAPNWDVERSNLFQAMNARYGGESKTGVDYLIAPWNLSVAAQPELAEYFDGVLGVAFLAGLPLLIFALWKLEFLYALKIGVAVTAVMFLFWLFSSQQLRYILPVLPVVSIAIAAAAKAISDSALLRYACIALCSAGVLVSVAWFLEKAPLRVVIGGESRDQYLARNLDYYPYYQILNGETATDSRVWLINMRRDAYNLERGYFSDYLFEDWTLRKMIWESRNVQELRAKAAAMNVQYVLARHDFLFDYDRTSIVDDRKPRAENESKMKIAKEFILDPARTIRSDQKFSLVKVF
jgi:4-amino-4-deoxy-L-arabinose transferase-like glycosyltransferase